MRDHYATCGRVVPRLNCFDNRLQSNPLIVPSMPKAKIFLVEKSQLNEHHILNAPTPPLAEGEVLFEVDRFAFTANNITYAAFGDAMQYWQFYPVITNTALGCIPVWGFATVLLSRCDGVREGERVYGYWPMATHAVLAPARITDQGFVDGAPHRAALHPVYNQYVRCAADPLYTAAHEAEQALLRPLFTTSFLIDDFLIDNALFGAKTVLLSSASSKTAYGTAFCLKQRGDAIKVIGLTSAANVHFVNGLGCYDDVVTYDAIASMPVQPAVYVDFAGSTATRLAVHMHFGDALVYSCAVGASHFEEMENLGKLSQPLPGAKPVFFFAPAQIKKRYADWGAAGFSQRTSDAWHAFTSRVSDAQSPWMRVVHSQGAQAIAAVYERMLCGAVNPAEGHMQHW
jgi:hypothetical protein